MMKQTLIGKCVQRVHAAPSCWLLRKEQSLTLEQELLRNFFLLGEPIDCWQHERRSSKQEAKARRAKSQRQQATTNGNWHTDWPLLFGMNGYVSAIKLQMIPFGGVNAITYGPIAAELSLMHTYKYGWNNLSSGRLHLESLQGPHLLPK